ncbi:MAG: hypothetical protein H0U74_10050 [Bradymonadaceae bacterium]|nr:hypothetical protein [Lujinxingiaceae bacterium]
MQQFPTIAVFVLIANVGLCGTTPKSAVPEDAAAVPAAERLQGGRNVYQGNVNHNLGALRDDLDETVKERFDEQSKTVEATK